MHKSGKSHGIQASLIAGLLLILMGLILVLRVFSKYEVTVLEKEDQQMMGLAQSVDRSVTIALNSYADDLTYIINEPDFVQAQQQWLQTGDVQTMRLQVQKSLESSGELVVDLLALRQDDTVLVSATGQLNYQFPSLAGVQQKVKIAPCLGEDGQVYLSFTATSQAGIQYACLVDLAAFYQRIAVDISPSQQDRITFLDAGGRTAVHLAPDGIHVDLVKNLQEGECDYSGISYLRQWQEQGVYGKTFYRSTDFASGENYRARMVAVPAKAHTNGVFAIGVSMNYDEFLHPLHLAAIRLMAYGGMAAVGIVILLIVAIYSMRNNQRTLHELELLRQKNEAMEQLNKKTSELAHHQRLEIMGTLTSSIAHEFNNLLTPIMSYSMLTLEKLPEESDLYDNILEIYLASNKAKKIISQLSDLSRKNPESTQKVLSPDSLLRKALNVATPAKAKMVQVKTKLHCEACCIRGNETQLYQLFLNLILNAFHAMEQSGGTLTVSSEVQTNAVQIQIQDTGCGIAAEILPHIFEPFFTTKESGKGTGLGLAIVQQILEEHSGSVEVQSKQEEGTVFTVRFPRVYALEESKEDSHKNR